MTALLGRSVEAAIIISETFSADGALVGTTPSPGPGNAWQNLSGTAGSLIVSGGKAQIRTVSTTDQDAETDFATTQTGTLYASFLLNMTTRPTSTGGDYFASFRSGTSYRGKIVASVPSGTGASAFRLGVQNNSATTVLWADELALNTEYRVVIRVNEVLDTTTLWINPVNESSTSVSTAAESDVFTSFSAFSFRQDGSASHGGSTIDNLLVATTFAEVVPAAVPEPGSFALGALAGLGFLGLGLRRRQNKI